jgi:hypothetical protein
MNRNSMIEEIIANVRERNDLRRLSGLPQLRLGDEVARHERLQREAEWERFFTANRPLYNEIKNRLVNRIRRRSGNPTYSPSGWFGGFGVHSYSMKVLRRMHRMERRLERDGR